MIIISINIVVNELKGFLPFLSAKGKWLVNWYGIEVEKMCKGASVHLIYQKISVFIASNASLKAVLYGWMHIIKLFWEIKRSRITCLHTERFLAYQNVLCLQCLCLWLQQFHFSVIKDFLSY